MIEKGFETLQEASRRTKLSVSWLRGKMRTGQLSYAKPGGRFFIPDGAIEDLMRRSTIGATTWGAGTEGHGSNSSPSSEPSISVGQKEAAASSVRQGRQTAARLKAHSKTGAPSAGAKTSARVIPLKR